MGLEAPFHVPVLIVVTKVINLKASSCISHTAILVAINIDHLVMQIFVIQIIFCFEEFGIIGTWGGPP